MGAGVKAPAMTTTLAALWTYSPLSRLSRALQRGWLSWARHRVACDLSAAQEHLAMVESDLQRQLPPEILADLRGDAEDLRARVATCQEELDYVNACYTRICAATTS